MYPDDPYRDPRLYDLEYADQTDDVRYYVALARRIRGPVLELGCGNGRITLPIARAGVDVHGVDASPEMLDDLERKVRREPDEVRLRVRHSQGDFRALALSSRYRLVIWPFNALHHCENTRDVLRVLGGVRDLLLPGGMLAIDCYLPDPILYARDPSERYEERTFADPRTGGPLESWEEGWWDSYTRIHHVYYVYRTEEGVEQRFHLRLHMFDQTELRELIHQAGYRIEWEASEFTGDPMRADALKWVMQLRAR